MDLLLHILGFLPKNLISRAFGWIAARETPQWFVRPFMRWFATRFGIDLSEAEKDFEDYPSLLALFTRKLKPGARDIEGRKPFIASPVDAKVGAFGRIEGQTLIQAKGLDYTLEQLLMSLEVASEFKDGWFVTLYLSPKDYHHIHSPDEGRITRTLYEPGTLWPVNARAVRQVPQLFAVNERVSTIIENDRARMGVVMVGATNVGRIRVAYDDVLTNRGGCRVQRRHDPVMSINRGDLVGTFELGSTVVLLIKPLQSQRFDWIGLESGRWYPLGHGMGQFSD